MSDGRFAACNLDRNGLRPARYVITKDKLITCASEVGIWDYQPDEVVEKRPRRPGRADGYRYPRGAYSAPAETDNDLKSRHPYKEWMAKNVRRLVPFEELPDEEVGSRQLDDDTLASYQKQFNYSAEEWTPSCAYWVKTARKRSAQWATIPHLPCSPASRVSFTITSASSSRR